MVSHAIKRLILQRNQVSALRPQRKWIDWCFFHHREAIIGSIQGHIIEVSLSNLPLKPMRKTFVLIMVLLAVTGCTLKATYNRLDWVLGNYLERYVALTPAQEAQLKQRLTATLEWHRTTQLPVYASWLQNVKYDVHHGLTETQVEQHTLELLLYWRTLMIRFADDMAEMLPELSPAQRTELFASFADRNAEYEERYIKVSRQQQRDNYTERLEDSFDSWLGSLSDQQQQLIQTAALELQPIATQSLQMRQRWQQQLKRVLENHRDPATTRAAMQTLFANTESLRSVTYRHMLEHNRQVITRLIVDVAQSLSDQQREHLNQRIDKYITLFTDLAQQAESQSAQCEAC